MILFDKHMQHKLYACVVTRTHIPGITLFIGVRPIAKMNGLASQKKIL